MLMCENFFCFGGNPKGVLGKALGTFMNIGHRKIHNLILNNIVVDSYASIIDIGCGGGKLVNLIASKYPDSKIYGIDPSKEMLEVSTKQNFKHIQNNTVEIKKASVLSIPYKDNNFDYAIACETIQFWPQLINSISEVYRILKSNGKLLIANRFPSETSKWYQKMQLKTANEYKKLLNNAKFRKIKISSLPSKDWIFIEAVKE